MSNRIEQIMPTIMESVRGGAKAALAQALEDTHSENQWDEIVERVAELVQERLLHDLRLADVVSEQDLFDAKGRINVTGIIGGFKSLVSTDRSAGDRARLEHLVTYLQSTCDALKLHRR